MPPKKKSQTSSKAPASASATDSTAPDSKAVAAAAPESLVPAADLSAAAASAAAPVSDEVPSSVSEADIRVLESRPENSPEHRQKYPPPTVQQCMNHNGIRVRGYPPATFVKGWIGRHCADLLDEHVHDDIDPKTKAIVTKEGTGFYKPECAKHEPGPNKTHGCIHSNDLAKKKYIKYKEVCGNLGYRDFGVNEKNYDNVIKNGPECLRLREQYRKDCIYQPFHTNKTQGNYYRHNTVVMENVQHNIHKALEIKKDVEDRKGKVKSAALAKLHAARQKEDNAEDKAKEDTKNKDKMSRRKLGNNVSNFKEAIMQLAIDKLELDEKTRREDIDFITGGGPVERVRQQLQKITKIADLEEIFDKLYEEYYKSKQDAEAAGAAARGGTTNIGKFRSRKQLVQRNKSKKRQPRRSIQRNNNNIGKKSIKH